MKEHEKNAWLHNLMQFMGNCHTSLCLSECPGYIRMYLGWSQHQKSPKKPTWEHHLPGLGKCHRLWCGYDHYNYHVPRQIMHIVMYIYIYIMLCFIIFCYILLHYINIIMLYYIILYCIMLYYVMLCFIILYYIIMSKNGIIGSHLFTYHTYIYIRIYIYHIYI